MRKLAFALGLLPCLLIAAPAGAHPPGNFTTNVHLGVEVAAYEINIRRIVDMAEIPTFRERPSIDSSGDRREGGVRGERLWEAPGSHQRDSWAIQALANPKC